MREGEQATAEVGILVNVVIVVIVVVVVKMTSVLVMLDSIRCQVRFLHVVERQYMLRLCPCQVGFHLKCDCYKYHYFNCYHYPHPLCFCHDRPHCPADQDSGQCTCEYVEPGQRVCSSLIEVDNPGVDQVRQTFQFATRVGKPSHLVLPCSAVQRCSLQVFPWCRGRSQPTPHPKIDSPVVQHCPAQVSILEN